MWSLLLLAIATVASVALAQNSSTPTVTMFLPMAHGSNVAASILTSAASSTVYAIGCLQSNNACAAGCTFSESVTVTGGPSMLRYVWTDGDRAVTSGTNGSLIHPVTTVSCNLIGGTRATQAVCTGYTMPNGARNASQVTTLSSSQLNYVPVMVTGQQAAIVASGSASSSGSRTASGSGSSASASASRSGAAASASASGGAGAIAAPLAGAAAVAAGLGAIAFL
ncbi:hypothetical protein BAUCODRAFT_32953 [Baudoinia panamericana UAMH 10762]|uniref:Ig-like domain-containing protein n=1 Tax=Baudoinia panamericana (strain UAMH 10762) TaxID=717646 RepID=M2LRV6_BAUPA|nr:uncharacterized protein BAUCODRAFT_32953 [Baudoinia panamericana UAMH 10762]EMC97212.1 hypothetical protein BAUCODRAFT_32953 [Baudoinia panamericana UAMH 10762]